MRTFLLCSMLFTCTTWSAPAVAASNKGCQGLFTAGKYAESAACFGKLYKSSKNPTHLNNQALVYDRWVRGLRGKAGQSCRLLKRAIELYALYAKRAKTKTEQIRARALLPGLRARLQTGSINITTLPATASWSLRGEKSAKKLKGSQTVTGLCPGKYRLTVSHPNKSTLRTQIELEPGQNFSRLYQLKQRPARPSQLSIQTRPAGAKLRLSRGNKSWEGRAPHTFTGLRAGRYELRVQKPQHFSKTLTIEVRGKRSRRLVLRKKPRLRRRCIHLTPALVVWGGAAALLAGGIGLHVGSDAQYQHARQKLSTSEQWKSHYDNSLTFAQVSGALYLSAGAAAAVGGLLLFLVKKPCP